MHVHLDPEHDLDTLGEFADLRDALQDWDDDDRRQTAEAERDQRITIWRHWLKTAARQLGHDPHFVTAGTPNDCDCDLLDDDRDAHLDAWDDVENLAARLDADATAKDSYGGPCPNGGPDHRAGVVGRRTCAWCDDIGNPVG